MSRPAIRVPKVDTSYRQIATRLTSQVSRRQGSGCWVWTGCTNKDGYGKIWHRGKHHQIHRLSYWLHFGEIPEGLNVLHRCDNPPCCNPDHLYLGSQRRNVRDREERGRGRVPVRRAGRWTGRTRKTGGAR